MVFLVTVYKQLVQAKYMNSVNLILLFLLKCTSGSYTNLGNNKSRHGSGSFNVHTSSSPLGPLSDHDVTTALEFPSSKGSAISFYDTNADKENISFLGRFTTGADEVALAKSSNLTQSEGDDFATPKSFNSYLSKSSSIYFSHQITEKSNDFDFPMESLIDSPSSSTRTDISGRDLSTKSCSTLEKNQSIFQPEKTNLRTLSAKKTADFLNKINHLSSRFNLELSGDDLMVDVVEKDKDTTVATSHPISSCMGEDIYQNSVEINDLTILKNFLENFVKGELQTCASIVEAFPEVFRSHVLDGLCPMHLATYYDGDPTEIFSILILADKKLGLTKVRGQLGETQMVQQKDKTGKTLLHHAAANGNYEACKFLIRVFKISVNDADEDGFCPIHMVAMSSRMGGKKSNCILRIVKLLIKKGASVNSRTSSDNKAPLHLAASSGNLVICKCLLDNYADPCAESNNFDQPLHFAVEKGHFSIVELLLMGGADIFAKNLLDDMPIHRAAASRSTRMIDLILRSRRLYQNRVMESLILMSKRTDGFTPLHVAANLGALRACQMLIDRGSRLNDYSDFQETPLDLAIQNGHLKICRLLIRNGAHYDIEKLITRWPKNKSGVKIVSMENRIKISQGNVSFSIKK